MLNSITRAAPIPGLCFQKFTSSAGSNGPSPAVITSPSFEAPAVAVVRYTSRPLGGAVLSAACVNRPPDSTDAVKAHSEMVILRL